jgi:hypothetical protein
MKKISMKKILGEFYNRQFDLLYNIYHMRNLDVQFLDLLPLLLSRDSDVDLILILYEDLFYSPLLPNLSRSKTKLLAKVPNYNN